MREIDELGSGIERLKRNSDRQKKVIEEMEKDRAFMIERTRFLGQKLSEAYVIYEEAGKKILDFVDKEIAPINGQLSELRSEVKRLSILEQELKAHTSSIGKMTAGDQEVRKRVLEAEKSLRMVNNAVALLKGSLERIKERENKEDSGLESRITELKGHFESRLKNLEERASLKITEASEEVLHDANDSINVVAAGSEELRKRLSETSLSVKQLHTSLAGLRKLAEGLSLGKTESERRLSSQQTILRNLESSLGKMEKRLDAINLEDDKLEKRLSLFRRQAEDNLGSKAAELKDQLESRYRRQVEEIDSKIKSLSVREIKLDREIDSVRKHAEGFASQRIDELKAYIESREKKHLQILDERHMEIVSHVESSIPKAMESERLKMGKEFSHISKLFAERDAVLRRVEKRIDGLDVEDRNLEKRLASLRRGMEDTIGKDLMQLKSEIDADVKSRAVEINSRIGSLSESTEGKIAKLKERMERINLEDEALEKKLSENRKLAEAAVSNGIKSLSSQIDGKLSAMDTKLERMNSEDSRFEGRQDSLRKGFEGRIVKNLAQIRRQSELEKRRQLELIGSRMKTASRALEESISGIDRKVDAKLVGFRLTDQESQKKQRELLEERAKAIHAEIEESTSRATGKIAGIARHIGETESRMEGVIRESQKATELREADLRKGFELSLEKVSKKLGGINVEEGRIEKGLMEARKHADIAAVAAAQSASKQIDAKLERLKEELGETGLHEERTEKRVEALRKGFEEKVGKDLRLLMAGLDSDSRKQAETFESRLAGLSEQIDAKLSKVSDKMVLEKQVISGMQSYVDRRVSDSQKSLAGKLDLLDEQMEKRTEHAYSQVASERKSLAETRALLEREIKAEQKALSARLGLISDSVDKKSRDLASQLAEERKALAAERMRFLEKSKSTGQAIAKLGEFSKSVEAELRKSQSLSTDKLKTVDSSMAGIVSKVQLLSQGIEKSSTYSKDVDARLSRVESLVGAEKKDYSMQFRAVESGLKAFTAEIAGLKKQLQHDAASKATLEKRLLTAEERIKALTSLPSTEEMARIKDEMLGLRQGLASWRDEQKKILELLKEDGQEE
jgi:chromosome segregation ATPase